MFSKSPTTYFQKIARLQYDMQLVQTVTKYIHKYHRYRTAKIIKKQTKIKPVLLFPHYISDYI